ncbi:LuxR C-terminal-related transcriptional regulator [Pseudomonas fragi]|uniref:LuxR C-terminal-related transcriptional regulator n=1 Tax=Pseudomonas fragi TaxID=296 RepID=UPI00309AAFED
MKLTHRDKEVLDLLLQGGTNKKIAQQLRISGFTVRDHVSSLLRKYCVRSRMELVVEIGRMGEGSYGLSGPLHR